MVEDNLNTHSDGSLYEAFESAEARRLAQRFERHHKPKHGSCLNIAESEISEVLRTSISDRAASRAEFEDQCETAAAWLNKECRKAGWQFTCEDSRIEFKSLYPSFQN